MCESKFFFYVAAPPKVLHYGLIFTVENTNYTFDKHWHYDFDATACPPWDMTTDRPKRGLFPHPPRASSLTTKVSCDLTLQRVPHMLVLLYGWPASDLCDWHHECSVCVSQQAMLCVCQHAVSFGGLSFVTKS